MNSVLYVLDEIHKETPQGMAFLAYILCGVILWGFATYLLIQLKRTRA